MQAPSASGRTRPRGPSPRARGSAARSREDEALWRIGELASAAGVSARTIRYYEDLGIFPVPERTEGGTRRYSRQWGFYLEGAIALTELGFTLAEVRLMVRLATGETLDDDDRNRATAIIVERQATLEHRLDTLNRLRDLLRHIDRNRGERTLTAKQMARLIADSGQGQPRSAAVGDLQEATR